MGLAEDTKTSASQFSYLATAFYVGYLFFEIPHGYLLQRLPVGKYLGTCGKLGILNSVLNNP
jgi:fucose permease